MKSIKLQRYPTNSGSRVVEDSDNKTTLTTAVINYRSSSDSFRRGIGRPVITFAEIEPSLTTPR